MEPKFIIDTIKNYEKIEDRARHIAEMLKIGRGDISNIEFNDDTIEYTFEYTCWGSTDYDYDHLPIKYMWMEDDEAIKDDYKKLKEKELEEVRMRKEEEERKSKLAQEKAERTMYERLKKKFENQ